MKNVALITGASSGLGREFAYIHAQRGGDLVVVARRKDKLQTLKKELEEKFGVEVMVMEMDLTEKESPHILFETISKDGIEVQFLINNAGFGLVGKFYKLDWNRQHQMIQLNITALTALTYLFLPGMVERNNGRILNISSTAGLLPGPLQAVYFATKAYVTSFSNALAEELHDTNVTVTTLMPGATKTEFGAISGMDKTAMFQKTASAKTVALDGYMGMLNGKLNVISGLTLWQRLLLAAIPFSPKKMLLKQIRKMQEV